MFIVIIGTKASGKEELAKYLTANLEFARIRIGEPSTNAGAQPDKQPAASESSSPLVFGSAKEIVKFVTPRWSQNFVTTDVTGIVDLHLLRKRPFVLIVGIEAPVGTRYKRYCARKGIHDDPSLTLEQFVDMDDELLYTREDPPKSPNAAEDSATDPDAPSTDSESTGGSTVAVTLHDQPSASLAAIAAAAAAAAAAPAGGASKPHVRSPIIRNTNDANELNLRRALAGAHVSIANVFPSIDALHEYLDELDLLNPERIRPSWDTYFMLLSELASHRSNCMKRKVGCILVKDTQIIATGYNGTPKGITNCNEGGCPRCNAGIPCGVALDHCLCIHAEENALLEAGRGRVRNAAGVTLYCNTCPCLGCAKKIVQVGVKTVVYSKGYGMDNLTLKLFKEAGIVVRQHTPPMISMEIGSP
ncbi:Deoxycytidine monophosphate (dCMP) deaminase [Coemansia sp. Benny D160-2]|nr:Deoxycytidine monophosphate (dCMP) deaminase [Coemansia sp. Benny D160-2]